MGRNYTDKELDALQMEAANHAHVYEEVDRPYRKGGWDTRQFRCKCGAIREIAGTGPQGDMNPRDQRNWNISHQQDLYCLLWYDDQLTKTRDMVSMARQECAAVVHTVVSTIGGTDSEGNPTSEINYLQRLRYLVEVERAYQERAKHQR